MTTSSAVRKPIGVRATPEQHRVLAEAAARQHRSISSFVLTTALEAAQNTIARPKRSRGEILTILRAARAEVQAANPTNRDLVQELLSERRAEAARD